MAAGAGPSGPAAGVTRPGAGLGLLLTGLLIGGTVVATGESARFFDPVALVIVLGGTLTVTLTSFPPADLATALRTVLRSVLPHSGIDVPGLAVEIVRLARLARREGLLVLEARLPGLDHLPILRRGIELLLEGREPGSVERVLAEEIANRLEPLRRAEAVLRRAAEVAPALGLVGTLVGLVRMLATLDAPESIGPGMAVALLTTLYGAVLAHAVFAPLAEMVAGQGRQERRLAAVQLEAVLSIGRRENPRLLAGLLSSALPMAPSPDEVVRATES